MNPKKIEPTSAKSRLGYSFVSLGGRFATAGGVAFAAVALALLFWWPLFRGAGFIGGDVYSYYLPQKVVYAEDLAAHRLPLWNNRAGHGYPIVGESQTGPFYPFNLFLYTLLPINLAYNFNHLFHYLLAFAFTWLYARSLALSRWAAGLAALVYVYGWFPSRSCWEWAIIGGAWMPAAFWCAEKFLSTRLTRFAFGLCAVLTLQLLAGHFNLAFLTLITLVPYVVLRLAFANRDLPDGTRLRSKRVGAIAAIAVVSAFGLAALQLGPTWELKQLSQRQAPGEEHNLAHGSIPLSYWSQMVEPWYWYSPYMDRDDALRKEEPAPGADQSGGGPSLFWTHPLDAGTRRGSPTLLEPRSRQPDLARSVGGGLDLHDGMVAWRHPVRSGLRFLSRTGAVRRDHHLGGRDPGRRGGSTIARNTGSLLLGIAVLISFGAAMWTALALTWQGLEMEPRRRRCSQSLPIGPVCFLEGMMSGLLLLGLIALILAVVAQLLNRDAKLRPRPRGTMDAGGLCPGDDRGRSLAREPRRDLQQHGGRSSHQPPRQ